MASRARGGRPPGTPFELSSWPQRPTSALCSSSSKGKDDALPRSGCPHLPPVVASRSPGSDEARTAEWRRATRPPAPPVRPTPAAHRRRTLPAMACSRDGTIAAPAGVGDELFAVGLPPEGVADELVQAHALAHVAEGSSPGASGRAWSRWSVGFLERIVCARVAKARLAQLQPCCLRAGTRSEHAR
jgi:hypothetical protein